MHGRKEYKRMIECCHSHVCASWGCCCNFLKICISPFVHSIEIQFKRRKQLGELFSGGGESLVRVKLNYTTNFTVQADSPLDRRTRHSPDVTVVSHLLPNRVSNSSSTLGNTLTLAFNEKCRALLIPNC